MRNISIRITLICISALLSPVQGLAADAVAMITDKAGSCTILSAGGDKPCDILTYLDENDRVSVSAESKLTLAFFSDSTEHVLQAGSEIRITGDQPVAISGKQPESRTLLLAKETGMGPQVTSGYTQAAIVLRGLGASRKLVLVSPRNTNVLSDQPAFKWKSIEKAASYRFVLTDESGKILADENLTTASYDLPVDLKLQPDVYYTWRVDSATSLGEKFSSSADFLVVSDEEKQRIEKLRPRSGAPVSEQVLFAAILEQSGFKDAATKAWKQLASRKPGNKVLINKAGH